jgi:EpsI family protein
VGESALTESAGNSAFDLRQTRLRSPDQRLLLWDWFRISGHDLTNPYVAKLLLARDRLFDRGDEAAAVIVGVADDGEKETAAETLREFVREMKPSIDAALDRIAATAAR